MLLITRKELNTAPGGLIKHIRRRLPFLLLVLVLFATAGVVLEEKPKGGEAKQEGLEEPQAACGHVGDAFVTAGTQKKYKKS